MMVAPNSSYSVLVIHINSKVEMDDKIDPPIQTVNFLSGEAMTLTSSFIDSGAKALIFLVSLSGNPIYTDIHYIEVPPDNII